MKKIKDNRVNVWGILALTSSIMCYIIPVFCCTFLMFILEIMEVSGIYYYVIVFGSFILSMIISAIAIVLAIIGIKKKYNIVTSCIGLIVSLFSMMSAISFFSVVAIFAVLGCLMYLGANF